ncbi:MAG TPA: L-lactate permease, partial [Oxalobacteraceae bacterium]|nr:L-lactate permease [Oxalobacteraceae bacterium]
PPIVKVATAYPAVYSFNWLAATGTAILCAAIVTVVLLRMKPGDALKTFGETLYDLSRPIYSI